MMSAFARRDIASPFQRRLFAVYGACGAALRAAKAAGEYGPGRKMQQDGAFDLPHRNTTGRWQDMALVPATECGSLPFAHPRLEELDADTSRFSEVGTDATRR
jgi:hypothetical protein